MATVDKDFRVKHGLIVEGTTGTINGESILTTGSTTDSLDEGTTNLYFTDERSVDAVATAIGNGTHTNITITYDDVNNAISFEGSTPITSTDDLAEGTTNLYFTDQRALDATASAYDPVGSASTAESNANSYTDTAIGNLDTDDISEGVTNLYYTDARVRSAITGGDGIDVNATSGEISASIGSGLQIVAGSVAIDDATVVTVDGIQNISNKTLGSDLDANNYTISNVPDPINDYDAANKRYVDAVAQGLHVHEQAHAIVTTPLATITGDTVTYNNGTSGVGATLTLSTALDIAGGDLDGDTDITIGDRLIVAGESNAAHNGIYVVTSTTVLTRASDFDTPTEMAGGDFIFVTHGTTYADTGWVLSEAVDTIGTDDVTFLQFSGAGTYTAGTGLALVGTVFSLDADTDDVPEGIANLYFTDQRAKDAVTTGLDTDDLNEGTTNLYFTDQRAIDAVVNGAVDTDDIEEGATNLYFTDQRAVDALEAVTPSFQEVDINSLALQVAATATLSDTNQTAVYSWAKASYRSAKLVVKAAYSTHTEVSEIIVTLDTSDNIAITEYAVVGTNGSLGAITAGINGTNVEILYTAGTASTDVTVFGTLIA